VSAPCLALIIVEASMRSDASASLHAVAVVPVAPDKLDLLDSDQPDLTERAPPEWGESGASSRAPRGSKFRSLCAPQST